MPAHLTPSSPFVVLISSPPHSNHGEYSRRVRVVSWSVLSACVGVASHSALDELYRGCMLIFRLLWVSQWGTPSFHQESLPVCLSAPGGHVLVALLRVGAKLNRLSACDDVVLFANDLSTPSRTNTVAIADKHCSLHTSFSTCRARQPLCCVCSVFSKTHWFWRHLIVAD